MSPKMKTNKSVKSPLKASNITSNSKKRPSTIAVEDAYPKDTTDVLLFKINALEMFDNVGESFAVSLEYDEMIVLSEDIISTVPCPCVEEYEKYLLTIIPEQTSHESRVSENEDFPGVPRDETTSEVPEYKYDSADHSKISNLANELVIVSVKNNSPDPQYPAECYLDIFPIICGNTDSIVFKKKKLEPSNELSILQRASWDNLPSISIEVSATRHQGFESNLSVSSNDFICAEFRILGVCNAPQVLSGSYSLTTVVPKAKDPFIEAWTVENPKQTKLNQLSKKYSWWSLETMKRRVKESDRKLRTDYKFSSCPSVPDTIQNTLNCLNDETSTLEWSVLYRTLIWKNTKTQFEDRLKFRWPFILSQNTGSQIEADHKGMGNFEKLLEPGVQQIFAVILLETVAMSTMAFECGLFEPFIVDTLSAHCAKPQQVPEPLFKPFDSGLSMSSTIEELPDSGDRIVLFVEIELSECLYEKPIPSPMVPDPETLRLRKLLMEKILKHPTESENLSDWKLIVDRTCTVISTQPLFGNRNFCNLTTILSSTSFWAGLKSLIHQTSSGFIAETTNIQEHLFNNNRYKELMRNTSIYLTRAAFDALHGREVMMRQNERNLKAARHAKKQRHYKHARELLLECLVQDDTKAELWRELGTLLRSNCRSSAITCYIKSNDLEPRNNLTLLCLATAIAEEDLFEAEPFFLAILALFPNWAPGLIASNAYLHKREQFAAAGMIVFLMADHVEQFWGVFTSYHGSELEEWWSTAPSLCASSIFIRTADLLLRIKANDLADVCLSKELILYGESPEYLFMLALSRALRGEMTNAIRICNECASVFGKLGSIMNLETQCRRIQNGTDVELELEAALLQAYHFPSAYNWIMVAKALRLGKRQREAEAVAIHALSLDRTEKLAWQELSLAVMGQSDRVRFYMEQADKCPDYYECFCDCDCTSSIAPVPSLYK